MGISPKDELNALLRLMSSSKEPIFLRKNDRIANKSQFYKLLEGWALRVPQQEKVDALNAIGNSYMLELPTAVWFWLGEQFMAHNLKISSYATHSLITRLSHVHQPNIEIVELYLNIDAKVNKTNHLCLAKVPKWAFSDFRTQSLVVDFISRNLNYRGCTHDFDVLTFFENCEISYIDKLMPLIIPKLCEQTYKILIVLALYDLINAQKPWKAQTQLLDMLDSEVVSNQKIHHILHLAFQSDKASMSKWLKYAASHWDDCGVHNLIEIMRPALKTKLMEGHIDHDVWKAILNTPKGPDTIACLWEDVLTLSPCINSELLGYPVPTGKDIAHAITTALDDPNFGGLLPKIALKSIAVERFFTACEDQWENSRRNKVFDDDKLLRRFKSKDFVELEKALKRLHPSVYGTLQALKYTVGAEEPDVCVVAKNRKEKIKTECDFSVSRSRWQHLVIKSNLVKITQSRPENAKVTRKI